MNGDTFTLPRRPRAELVVPAITIPDRLEHLVALFLRDATTDSPIGRLEVQAEEGHPTVFLLTLADEGGVFLVGWNNHVWTVQRFGGTVQGSADSIRDAAGLIVPRTH